MVIDFLITNALGLFLKTLAFNHPISRFFASTFIFYFDKGPEVNVLRRDGMQNKSLKSFPS